MEPIQIRIFSKQLDIRLTGRTISLPQELRVKIEDYWQELLEKNPMLHNGEVFTVTSVKEDGEAIHIQLDETSYAHYLYSRQTNDLGERTVRIIHPAALIISSDNQLIFGSMGSHTSLAGIIQCCGGGIDRRAVGPDGDVAIDKTITSELAEELGIIAHDERVASMTPIYLKFGGPTGKMTLVYIVRLHVTSEKFMRDYAVFAKSLKAKDEEPEFGDILHIKNDTTTIEAFIEQHEHNLSEYMPILLRAVANRTTTK